MNQCEASYPSGSVYSRTSAEYITYIHLYFTELHCKNVNDTSYIFKSLPTQDKGLYCFPLLYYIIIL